MNQPIITKKTLENYLVIDQPCTAECTVAATVRPNHLINGTIPYYVVYLRVIRKTEYKRILKILDDLPYLDFIKYRSLFVTGVVFENQIKDGFNLPTKGEKVIVTFDYKRDKLWPKHVELKPAYQLQRLNIKEIHPLLDIFEEYLGVKNPEKLEL